MADPTTVVHASAVAWAGRGLLIRGASGKGKSGIALDLMSRGAQLVADDGVVLERTEAGVMMHAPETLQGMIEARGLGLLSADYLAQAPLSAVLDLDAPETDRLPPRRETTLLGQKVPLLHFFDSPYFPAALMQYLKGGIRD